MADRFVVLSGCSGGGKSSILEELARRGHATVAEPGRRIVRQALAGDGGALPWRDPADFARRAVALSLADRESAARRDDWVFFDRGLVDAASALEHATGRPALQRLGRAHRYHGTAFLVPPWPEIAGDDPERRFDLAEAVAEYRRLVRDYAALDYRVVVVPTGPVPVRADAVLAALGLEPVRPGPDGSGGDRLAPATNAGLSGAPDCAGRVPGQSSKGSAGEGSARE